MDYINPYRLWFGSFVPNWLLRRKEISPGAKLCYARLAQFADKVTGIAWPGRETVGDELGVSDAQVDRYVDELKKAGLIETKRRGQKQSNLYRFPRHAWMEFADHDKSDMSTPDCSDMRTHDADSSDVSTPNSSYVSTPDSSHMSDKENQEKRFKEKNQEESASSPNGDAAHTPIAQAFNPDGAGKTEKTTNPDIHRFLADWHELFQRQTSEKYIVGGKDAALVKKLLTAYPLDRLLGMAQRFFASDDPWMKQAGLTIGVFFSQANKFASTPDGFVPKVPGGKPEFLGYRSHGQMAYKVPGSGFVG